jgi:hypothetical protein
LLDKSTHLVVEQLKLHFEPNQFLECRHVSTIFYHELSILTVSSCLVFLQFPEHVQVLLPVYHKEQHWSVYNVNFTFGQIDVLDPCAGGKKLRHKNICKNIRHRLNAAISTFTEKKSARFDWDGLPFITFETCPHERNCVFDTMYYLKYYNGDKHKVDYELKQVTLYHTVQLDSGRIMSNTLGYPYLSEKCRHRTPT